MEENGGGARKQEAPVAASKAAVAGVSVNEWLQHIKASFLGLVSHDCFRLARNLCCLFG